jgi:hypothetical protein
MAHCRRVVAAWNQNLRNLSVHQIMQRVSGSRRGSCNRRDELQSRWPHRGDSRHGQDRLAGRRRRAWTSGPRCAAELCLGARVQLPRRQANGLARLSSFQRAVGQGVRAPVESHICSGSERPQRDLDSRRSDEVCLLSQAHGLRTSTQCRRHCCVGRSRAAVHRVWRSVFGQIASASSSKAAATRRRPLRASTPSS